MTESARDRTDNPRWLAALVTALPVALAVLLTGLFPPTTAKQPEPIVTRSANEVNVISHAEPDPELTVARTP